MSEAAAGGFFPVYGVCLGFEALSIALAGGNRSLLTHFDAEDTAAPLLFTPAARKSQLYGRMGERVLRTLEDKPYARESHSWGVSLESLMASRPLAEAVDVLSLSADNTDGKVYVSSWEHRRAPVWATQFHPEKNAFEWGDALAIPHDGRAVVALTQAFANVFVDAARRAGPGHGVSLEAEGKGALDDLLIYNTPPVFTGRHDGPDPPFFDQAYVFGPWKEEVVAA
jgi:gamma-glutamyl hydrolase